MTSKLCNELPLIDILQVSAVMKFCKVGDWLETSGNGNAVYVRCVNSFSLVQVFSYITDSGSVYLNSQ